VASSCILTQSLRSRAVGAGLPRTDGKNAVPEPLSPQVIVSATRILIRGEDLKAHPAVVRRLCGDYGVLRTVRDVFKAEHFEESGFDGGAMMGERRALVAGCARCSTSLTRSSGAGAYASSSMPSMNPAIRERHLRLWRRLATPLGDDLARDSSQEPSRAADHPPEGWESGMRQLLS
jgi:hypothetical protein